ncbi:MAG: hypothetical protein AB7C98_07765 [Acidithiobacillus sp.]
MRGITFIIGAIALSFASMSLAKDNFIHEKIPTIPLLKMILPHGQWQGVEYFDTNGFTLKHKESHCINSRALSYWRLAFGQKADNKYVPENCVVDIQRNTSTAAKATEICVPLAKINQAITYFHNNGSITGFSNYTKNTVEAKLEHGGLLFQHTVQVASNGKIQTSVHHGYFVRRSGRCVPAVKIPNLAELKKEGKHVPTNAELNRIDDHNPAFRKAFGNH